MPPRCAAAKLPLAPRCAAAQAAGSPTPACTGWRSGHCRLMERQALPPIGQLRDLSGVDPAHEGGREAEGRCEVRGDDSTAGTRLPRCRCCRIAGWRASSAAALQLGAAACCHSTLPHHAGRARLQPAGHLRRRPRLHPNPSCTLTHSARPPQAWQRVLRCPSLRCRGGGQGSRDNNVHKVAQWEAGRAAAREGGCSSAATAAWLGLKRPLTPPHATDSRRGSLEQHASSPSTLGCRFRPPRGWEGPPAGQLGPTSLVGPEWHAGRLGWLPRHSPARGQRLLALQRLLDAIRCCCHREGVRQPQKRAEAEPLEHFGAAPAAR